MPPRNEPTAGADAEKDKQIAFLKAALQERDREIGKCLLDVLLSFSKRLYLPDALKAKRSEAKQLKIPKPHGQAGRTKNGYNLESEMRLSNETYLAV